MAERAKIGIWECQQMTGGDIRCSHTGDLRASVKIGVDGISGFVELPSFSDDYELDVQIVDEDFEF